MIRWGMIGCGSVTEMKSGPAFSKVDHSQLLAVSSRTPGHAYDYAQRHDVPKVFEKPTELINDPGIDAVYVATPPDSHMAYALEVIRAGKPVYLEKPMARNYKECESILEESEKKGVPVFVAYYRRGLPSFVRIKKMVEDGELGQIRLVRLNLTRQLMNHISGELPWRVIPEISGGGLFVDLASHQLDYLDFLAGPVSVVSSVVLNQGGKYRTEDIVVANLMINGSIPCAATWCFSAHEKAYSDDVELVGEKASVSFSCFDYRDIVVNSAGRSYTFKNERPEHIQMPLIDLVVKDLLGTDRCPSTGITAARTSKVLDEILKDYYKK